MIDDEGEDEDEDDDENLLHKHRTVDENNRSIYLSKPIIAAILMGNLTIASKAEGDMYYWLAG